MDARAKNRVRLWLQTEKIFGLPSVPAPAVGAFAAAVDEAEAQASGGAAPVATPQVREVQQRRDVVEPVRTAPVADPAAEAVAADQASAAPGSFAPAGLFAPDADAPAFDAPPLETAEKAARLAALNDKEVRGCTKCRLCETRKNTVFGEGDPDAKIFFIGEGPGENEDLTGRPFVGRAGELLNKWIAAMGLKRQQVFIANTVKCRPPGNREPAPDEVATCTPYLQRQLEIVRPAVIITLGRPASQYMLQTKLSMSRLRGQWQQWRGIKLMPTYHPAYVLRQYTYETRSAVWSDLKKVMAELGLPEPKRDTGK